MSTAIITGSSRGIGLHTALRFAEAGYKVFLNALHDSPALKEAAEKCSTLSHFECPAICGDVSNPAFAAELVRKAAASGPIDVLINNAGISHVGLLQDTDDETWQKVINTNLSSVHFLTRAVVPEMLKVKSGRIINVSSVWGEYGASCEVAYSASKGGVNAYTKAAAKELAPSGISVNAVACGCIKTDMLSIYSEEELNALCDQIPYGKLGDPKDIADIILKMAEMPTYLTGKILTVDGGWI